MIAKTFCQVTHVSFIQNYLLAARTQTLNCGLTILLLTATCKISNQTAQIKGLK